ncbi:MAG: surface lipoprotein assembly modifier [Gemmobacter sp.]
MGNQLRHGLISCILALSFLLLSSVDALSNGRDAPGAQGNVVQAWERAQQLVRDARPRAAIPLLEGILARYPDQASVHAQLGAVYVQTRNHRRARHHLQQAQAGNLSAQEQQGVARLLRRMDQTRAVGFSFTITPLYEANPEQRTSADTIFLGGIPFTLEGEVEPSFGMQARLGVSTFHMIGEDLAFTSQTTLNVRAFEDERLNDFILRSRAGLSFHGDMGRETGVGIVAMRRWIANKGFSHEIGPYLSYSRRLNQKTRFAVRSEQVALRYDRHDQKDGWRNRTRLDISHGFDNRLSGRLGVYASLTRGQIDRESGLELGVSGGLSFRSEGGLMLSADVLAMNDRRDGASALIGERRRDRVWALQLEVSHARFVHRGFRPSLTIRREVRRSNLPVANYTNTSASISFSRAF